MILLDTQVVLWLMSERKRLSTDAIVALRRERQTGAGIAMAWTKRRIQLRGALSDYLSQVESTFSVLPISGSIAARSMLFTPQYPRDPADRIIGATAVIHG